MNQFFVVYNPNTGAVLRTGTCQPGMVEHQAGPGDDEMFLETDQMHNPNTIRVDLQTGEIVPR
jgi:hypothetical protein